MPYISNVNRFMSKQQIHTHTHIQSHHIFEVELGILDQILLFMRFKSKSHVRTPAMHCYAIRLTTNGSDDDELFRIIEIDLRSNAWCVNPVQYLFLYQERKLLGI